MTCPSCRQMVEEIWNLKENGVVAPKHNAWFVCDECGSISRFLLLGGVMMLRTASIDEFADSEADHAVTIQARREIVNRIGVEKRAAFAKVKAAFLRATGRKTNL